MRNFIASHPLPAYVAGLILWAGLLLVHPDAQANDTPAVPGGNASDNSALAHLSFGQMQDFFSDSAITAQIKTALIGENGVEGLSISVETHQGKVILSGFVDNETRIRRAVEIASSMRGVQHVTNGLQVKG